MKANLSDQKISCSVPVGKKANRPYKFMNIIVNGRIRVFNEENITYNQVIALAFNAATVKSGRCFMVTYHNPGEKDPEEILLKGDSIRVKPGMVFKAEVQNTHLV